MILNPELGLRNGKNSRSNASSQDSPGSYFWDLGKEIKKLYSEGMGKSQERSNKNNCHGKGTDNKTPNSQRRIKSLDNRNKSEPSPNSEPHKPGITLESILEKLYFDNYNFNDIAEHLETAFKNIKDSQSFFNIVCQSIRNFTEVKSSLWFWGWRFSTVIFFFL